MLQTGGASREHTLHRREPPESEELQEGQVAGAEKEG